MKNKKLIMAAGIAIMMAGSACAEFVGSLLHEPDTNFVGVYYHSALSRITNGDVETRGTVQGLVQWQGSHTNTLENVAEWPVKDTFASTYAGMQIKSFALTTQTFYLSRLNANYLNGVVAWDFDFSGIDEDYWAFKYILSRNGSRSPDLPLTFYISYNGDGISLDESVISSQDPGTLSGMVDDTTLYRKVVFTESGIAATQTNTIDITDHMEQAIANGGKVRLVLRDKVFSDVIVLRGDSGFHATNVNIGAVGGDYRVLTHFDETSGTLPITYDDAPYGSWAGSGPEAKEYNLSSSGVLDIRDADADEGGGGEHGGLLDTVTFDIPGGIAFTNIGEALQVDLSYGIYQDTSGASTINSNPVIRISLTDSTSSSNSGIGWVLMPILASNTTEAVICRAYSFDGPTATNTQLSSSQDVVVVQPYDGTLRTLQMHVVKLETGSDVGLWMNARESSDWTYGTGNGQVRGLNTGNSFLNHYSIDATVFDTLTISIPNADIGLKIDDLAIFTSQANPEFSAYTAWIAGYPSAGELVGYTDDPDADGFDNLHEWALGGNPTNAADFGYLSTYGTDGSTMYYTFPSNTLADDVLYTLEVTDDLVTPSWATGPYAVGNAADLPNPNFVTVSNSISTTVESEQFIRLTIEQN